MVVKFGVPAMCIFAIIRSLEGTLLLLHNFNINSDTILSSTLHPLSQRPKFKKPHHKNPPTHPNNKPKASRKALLVLWRICDRIQELLNDSRECRTTRVHNRDG